MIVFSLYNKRYKFCNGICNGFVTVNCYPKGRNEEAKEEQDKPEKRGQRKKSEGIARKEWKRWMQK